MKQPFLKVIIVFVFVMITVRIYSQTDFHELDSISNVYKKARTFHFDLKYKLFKDYNTKVESEAFTMSVYQNNDSYFSKRVENEVLINEKYALIVDHENKVVLIDKYMKAGKRDEKAIAEMGIDSILKKIAVELKEQKDYKVNVSQKELNDKEKQYTFHYPKGEYTAVAIDYNRTTFFINKVTLFYREKISVIEGQPETAPRIEVDYVLSNLHPEFQKKLFSEKRYASVKKDGSLELVTSLKNYKIINHLRNE